MIIENHLHKKGFALVLVLKQRLAASRKWPINLDVQTESVYNPVTCLTFKGKLRKRLPDDVVAIFIR